MILVHDVWSTRCSGWSLVISSSDPPETPPGGVMPKGRLRHLRDRECEAPLSLFPSTLDGALRSARPGVEIIGKG